jgi:hypothetical protein
MNFDLNNPRKGDRLSAAKLAELIREVRSNRLLQSPGVRISRTPHGTHIEVEVPRAPAAARPDNGCWKIVPSTREEDGENEGETVKTPVRVFANQYYLMGEMIIETDVKNDDGQDAAVEDFVCQGELSSGEEYTADDKPYVALKVPAVTVDPNAQVDPEAPKLVGYYSLEDLQAAQREFGYSVKPLYKFTHNGAVAVDFRNCPALQVTEVPR